MTYFKLNPHWQWESFEYNPFMGDNFRTVSGGGITASENPQVFQLPIQGTGNLLREVKPWPTIRLRVYFLPKPLPSDHHLLLLPLTLMMI